MADELHIAHGTRKENYESLLPQLRALVSGETDVIANCANIAAALRQTFGFWWVGFYFVKSESDLVLGPFQGDIACTRITKGKGVCGKAWSEEKTIIVDDVETFPGHIACSAASKSEIVVPIKKGNKIVAVLDVDSDNLADFTEVDKIYLEELALLVSNFMDS